ncbi:MAG: hypothetical protein COV44_03575 [Deltaproteobacteria bacterium CG11_big_fil_rev_8_21_14_0_20_45_16]|nr:MAG: hypothetical protein COV44_03575 [Deltaproteobacteria bacterium CG11_big_fil_rev_8_21_14_0_20_45_16]
MTDLNDSQSELSSFLYSRRPSNEQSSRLIQGLKDDGPVSPILGLQIYRNNLRVSLVEALKEAYPLTRRFLGEDVFKEYALRFIYEYTSFQNDLNRYGEGFWYLFDKENSELSVFLKDFTQLEWTWHQLDHEVEDEILGVADLQNLLRMNPEKIVLKLRSSMKLLHLETNVFPIFQSLRSSCEKEQEIQTEICFENQALLLFKSDGQRRIDLVEKELLPFLERTAQGIHLNEFVTHFLSKEAGTSLEEALYLMISRRWLSKS